MTTIEGLAEILLPYVPQCGAEGNPIALENAGEIVRELIEALKGDLSETQYEALSATGKQWRELDSTVVWNVLIDAILVEPRP